MSRKVIISEFGEVVATVNSVRECCEWLKLCRSSTMNRLNHTTIGWDDYDLAYAEDKPRIIIYKEGIEVMVKPNIKQVHEYTGVCHQTIERLLKDGKEFRGWSFDEPLT